MLYAGYGVTLVLVIGSNKIFPNIFNVLLQSLPSHIRLINFQGYKVIASCQRLEKWVLLTEYLLFYCLFTSKPCNSLFKSVCYVRHTTGIVHKINGFVSAVAVVVFWRAWFFAGNTIIYYIFMGVFYETAPPHPQCQLFTTFMYRSKKLKI